VVQVRVLAMLHLYSPSHNAGAETTAHELLRRLVDRGHQVVVQLSMVHPMFHTGPYVYEGVRVYPYRDKSDPLRWVEGEHPPDLIVAHLSNVLRASVLGEMYNIPVVVLLHNGHTKSFADLRHGAKLVVYNTEWMRLAAELWWSEWMSVPPPASLVVHPPVFRDRYRVKPPSARNGYVTLVNLFQEKGSSVFYALAARFPELKFLGVCGAYGEQDIRRDLPNVTIVPHVAAHAMPAEVFAKTRVLLMPSHYESYGRCGVEASCSGIPTIAAPTLGLVEALGDAGTFVEVGDLAGWVAALTRLSTTRGWGAASQCALGLASGLDPVGDLERWVAAAESLVAPARVPSLV
jgi:glycosyltransferase involved in cell wall biosynthesis